MESSRLRTAQTDQNQTIDACRFAGVVLLTDSDVRSAAVVDEDLRDRAVDEHADVNGLACQHLDRRTRVAPPCSIQQGTQSATITPG